MNGVVQLPYRRRPIDLLESPIRCRRCQSWKQRV